MLERAWTVCQLDTGEVWPRLIWWQDLSLPKWYAVLKVYGNSLCRARSIFSQVSPMNTLAASFSTADRPAKRQRRLSEDTCNDPNEEDNSPASWSTTASNLPRTQLKQILRRNSDLALPALRLLDLYLCLWESYVVKSAESIRLEDERRQICELNELLEEKTDSLLQCCNRQAVELESRKRTVNAFHGNVMSALQIIDLPYYRIDRPWFVHRIIQIFSLSKYLHLSMVRIHLELPLICNLRCTWNIARIYGPLNHGLVIHSSIASLTLILSHL
jgi:hypothetical protein